MVRSDGDVNSSKTIKQLVIIGNGFDLRCSLPSNYTDFRKDRERYFSREGEGESVLHTRTIWDTVLSVDSLGGWADVEGAIARWVSPSKSKTGWRKHIEEVALYMRQPDLLSHAGPSDISRAVMQSIEELRKQYGQNCDRWQVFSYFLDELHILENDFKSYLIRTVKANEGYGNRANRLLFSILSDGAPSQDEATVDYGVLSFNYTRVAENYGVGTPEGRKPIWYSNIHGRLIDEIIFGIDATNRLEKGDVAQFTKTYRVLCRRAAGSQNGFSEEGSGVSPETNVIKFFGHSLGDADHSYFQSLFDIVGLYEGSTKLIFYFCPYKRTNGEEVSEPQARNEMMIKVLKLLSAYGKSLENEYHGNNLVHKLMLEDRIAVRLLPEKEWTTRE